MYLSKTNYTCADQCYKKLWLKKFRPDLAEIDAVLEARFKTGHMVGEYARRLFPGGVLIEFNENFSIMAEKTESLLKSGVKVIYEAVFVYDNLIAICDILVVTESGFEIFEVKSSTEVKDVYYNDISFQCVVVAGCGYNVAKAVIVHIDKQFIRRGEIDYYKLFATFDATKITKAYSEHITNVIPDILKMLEKGMPGIGIGSYCSTPYQCEFSKYCRNHLPEYSVFNLYRIGQKAYEYYYNGIISMEDVAMSGMVLKGIQKLQQDAEKSRLLIADKEKIRQFISTLKYPLYFLDFETFMEAIPSYDGCRPYEQIPFQYSLHYMESETGQLKHKEFLAIEGVNPKEALVRQLCTDISPGGTVLVYNISFEGTIISKLAEEFPEWRERLLGIKGSFVDLIIPFRSGYYYENAMRGSFSIKSVLKALFPNTEELDYSRLEIKNGSEAMTVFPTMRTMSYEDRLKTREALLEYCKLDTFAMVKILEKLKGVERAMP